ncbi:MAG TPA: tetratricopeptide repeat protein [Chitinispirillaceae bacterium]|nr:tetratricopeptide repeat protein [Chitinispirillaceae bacterium]
MNSVTLKMSIAIRLILLVVLSTISLVFAADIETGDYIHYRLGVKYKNEKKFEAAIDEFRKVLAAYPDNYNAYMYIAEIRAAENKPRLVIYNLKKALNYNPGWGKAHKLLSVAYEKDGQIQKSIVELQQYIQYCDPAERDSLQYQIDRLIQRVNGGTSRGTDSVQESVSGDSGGSTKNQPIADVNNKDTTKKPEGSTISSERRSSGSGKTLISGVNSELIDELFNNAVTAYNAGTFDEAVEDLKKVLQKNPTHSGAYYYAGLIRLKKGQAKMAKINFIKAVNFPELGHNAHFYLGKIYGDEKNYSEAIRQLNLYISKSSYEAGKKEAETQIESYRNAMAPEMIDSVLKGGAITTAPPVQKQVVVAPEKYNEVEIRIDSLLVMLAVDTLSDLGQQLLKGIKLFQNGEYDNSVKSFREVLAIKPSGTPAMHCIYNTGICYFKLGLYKDAENQFQQILERFPGQPVAPQCLFLKAMTYLHRGEPALSENLLRKFIQEYRYHSWSGKAFEMLGDAYIDMEQPKKAIDAYANAAQKSLNGYADRVFALYKLGTACLQIGNQTRGIQAFQNAIETGEKYNVYVRVPDSYYRIADEKFKSKDFKGALEYYTKVTRKYPAFQETAWGLFQIGSIHKNLGDYQSAVKMFKELIQRYPDDYWSKQAQWKIDDSIWENEYKAVLR